MNILGIETSCDETAAAIVRNGKVLLSNVVTSSLKEHIAYGGIIPEIASRRQLEYMNAVVKKSLTDAKLNLKDIDAIAVTMKPGLIGSLLVGISYARSLSYALNKPLIEVDHIESHLYANFMIFDPKNFTKPELPCVGLIVSGGHTSLYYIKRFPEFKPLGHTLDDAAGETFDKVARILGLGYPGGPKIEKVARQGENNEIHFNCAALPGTFNFSFSGIKTAVLYHKRDHIDDKIFSVAKIAYSFQKSVISVLVKKSIKACLKFKTKTLLIGGGVAANSELRRQLKREASPLGIKTFFPPISLCTDNAAMIAGLGYHRKKERNTKIV